MERAKSLELASALAVAAALAALVAWSFSVRYGILTETPFPVGIDGYFYPIQLRSLLDHGSLAYPASPLGFWLMAPLALLTDPITGAKLGAALFGALIALPAYGLGARLGKSRGAGLVCAALATTSAGSMFLTIEFVKNGIGLTIGMTALWLVLRALEKRTVLRLGLAAAGVIGAFLAHKMAAGIVVLIAVPAAIAEAAEAGELRGRRLLYALGRMAVLLIITVVIGLAFPERFLSPGDASLSRSLLGPADWSLPALATRNVTLSMGSEAAIGAVLAVLAAITLVRPDVVFQIARAVIEGLLALRRTTSVVWLVRRVTAAKENRRDEPAAGDEAAAKAARDDSASTKLRRGERIASWVIVALGLAIALPWLAVSDAQGLGFRIRIIAFVPMALCAAIVARAFVLAMRRWIAEAVLAAIALAIVLAMPHRRVQGQILAHPAMVAAVEGLAGRIPDGGIAIVPERHIAFMVTWYTGAPHRLRPESVPRDKRWRVMPLAFIGPGSPLDDALIAARREPAIAPPIGTHPGHVNGLVIVPEATWEWILQHLPAPTRDYFTRWPTI